MSPSDGNITHLLHQWREGSQEALDRLAPLVYEELRRLARAHMRKERVGHTLQTTALLHEAYVRLIGLDVSWQDRVHFLAVASTMMRRVLVDHARARRSAKRGGGASVLKLDSALAIPAGPTAELLDLDAALGRLTHMDVRKARAIEMHFFGGLTHEEIAEALGVSIPTVQRDLRFAQAWLLSELSGRASGDA
ncbi:MAG TPA: sigma-70 family RNA polymerase sigma factor [Candidatus Polarisedimenticolia bacterium]|nr:sigma-70 family RNA polymerase sigma factor [Candidatus Polarisedimenticolia bacterium]